MERQLPKNTTQVIESFYINPATGNLPVSIEGICINHEGKLVVGETYGYYEYLIVGKIAVHRAVALTFLPCPGNPDDYQVNHINGNKLCNHVDNLEWVTRSENAHHAYRTGLRADNKPVLIKDLTTEEITRYHSLNELARAYSSNGSTISLYISRDIVPKTPWRNKYSIIFEGDDWPVIPDELIIGHSNDIIAIPEDDRDQVLIFQDLVSAGKYLKCNKATIGWYLNRLGKKKDNLYKGYRWYYYHEYPETFPGDKMTRIEKVKEKRKFKNGRKPVPVRVTCLKTNDMTVWKSMEEYAASIGMKKNTLQKYVGMNKGSYLGNKIEYIEQQKVPLASDGQCGTLLIAGSKRSETVYPKV